MFLNPVPLHSLITLVTGLLLWAGISPARAQSSACQPLFQTFERAIQQLDIVQIAKSADEVLSSAGCSADERRRAARLAALAHGEHARRMSDAGHDDGARLRVLEAGARFDKPWQLMAAIGDLKQRVAGADGRTDFGGASLAYQQALSDIDKARSSGREVPRDALERIERLASQTRMLAPTFTSGREILDRDPRNVMVEAVPVPIQFVYDSDRMTELGQKYAAEMLEVLKGRSLPAIVLIGHTDPIGSESYNDALSLRRAAAIKSYLIERGYPGERIAAEGHGKRVPLKIEDVGQYTTEQIHQMLRRVELKLR